MCQQGEGERKYLLAQERIERRAAASRYILGHADDPFLSSCMMYGVRVCDMTVDEMRAMLAYVLKNPGIIAAMVPDKPKSK